MKANLYGTSIDQYLNLQDYYPISSDEFMEKFNIKCRMQMTQKYLKH